MDNKHENVEIFEDEEIVTLYDDNDQPVDFAEVACVEYEGKYYALLQPVEEVEGIEEDEVIVCLIEPQDDESEIITPVTDEELSQKVFDEYLKAAADSDCDCDCDCDCDDEEDDDCDCGCGGQKNKDKDCGCKH